MLTPTYAGSSERQTPSTIFSQSKPGCRICPQGEFNGRHQEHLKMAKCPVCKYLIKNCKCQRTEHRGKTCQDGKSLDEQSMCCKVCGKPEDSCPGRCNAYKKDPTMTSVDTRYKSTRMEQRREGSQGERWDKIDHFIPLTPVQSQTPQSLPEQPTRSSESGVTKQNQQSTKKLQVITAMKNSL